MPDDELTLSADTMVIRETAQDGAIVDLVSYQHAWDRLKAAKALKKRIEGYFAGTKRKLDEAKRDLLDKEKAALRPVHEAIDFDDKRIKEWDVEQRRRREAEYAEKIRAERKRQEDEQLARAEQLEAEGRPDEALAALATPAPLVAPPPEKAAKIDGGYIREDWRGEGYNIADTLAFIVTGNADSPIAKPELLYLVDYVGPRVNDLARAQRDSLQVPGIRVVKKTSTVTK